MAEAKKQNKVIAENRKAFHDYFIEETIECGIVLAGTEVKSLRAGKVNLRESYAVVKDGEVFVCGMHRQRLIVYIAGDASLCHLNNYFAPLFKRDARDSGQIQMS